MEIITWQIIAAIFTGIIAPAARNWLKENAHRSKSERFREAAEAAVRVAEEHALTRDKNAQMSGQEKHDMALRILDDAFPGYSTPQVSNAIIAALGPQMLGKAAKKANSS